MKKATAIIIGISCLFGIFALTCLAAVFGDADADGSLSANDAAVVLQKVLRNDYKMPVENTENDYMYITDVDRDGSLSAADSASILQKVLRNDYKMLCETDYVTAGKDKMRGLTLDNVLHSQNVGDIHFSDFIPESYDGTKPYSLFVTLPGWEGLYFQGVGANLEYEDYATEAQKYNDEMIILAPQLNDWGETSANQTIALTEYFIKNYNIENVYLEGYSGGGETGSLVIGKAPELYKAFLIASSQWDGDLNVLANAKTPVYMATAENDSYYGSAPLKNAYSELYNIYSEQGISEEQISRLLVLDIKSDEYCAEHNITDTHAAGFYFAHEEDIMGWLFGSHNEVKTPDFTVDTKISDVINYPSFGEYGRLLFPANSRYYSGNTLKNLSLTWYSEINPNKTVEVVNYLKNKADSGEKIFYDIYTAEEKAADPRKEDTGLFFFKGNEGAKFAVCNAGGGFVYVGAMHDSFPHALELSKKGYNAFALIYRPGSQTACEDLARAIAFIHENADALGVDVTDYSLWGGSAGARMAAWLGSYGTEYFGEKDYPRPAAVIMQYTGLSEVTGTEPPTYNCVGTYDGIADYTVMQNRIDRIKQNGTDAEIEVFDGLSHGFGLGEGTVAYGWLDNAVKFWERQMM